MAKSKRRTAALYEVIDTLGEQKQPAKLGTPSWWQNKAHAASSNQRSASSAAAPQQGGSRSRVSATNGPSLRINGNRLEISLSSVSAAVAIGVVLLGVFTCYQLGAMLNGGGSSLVAGAGDQNADQELSNLGIQPGVRGMADTPTRPLMSVMPPEVASKPPVKPELDVPPAVTIPIEPEPQQGRQADLNYVILARYRDVHKEEALHTQQWLADKQSIGTTLERINNLWWLISTDGFDYNSQADKQRCRQFCENLRVLHRAYKADFRGDREVLYAFDDPEVRKGETF